MTEAEARALLERMVSNTTDPVLSSADMDELVKLAKRADASGVLPTAAGWTPTWDLNAAAAEGWRWKAGRASALFNFAEDGQRFDRAQLYAHCVAMAEEHARGDMGSVKVQSATTTEDA